MSARTCPQYSTERVPDRRQSVRLSVCLSVSQGKGCAMCTRKNLQRGWLSVEVAAAQRVLRAMVTTLVVSGAGFLCLLGYGCHTSHPSSGKAHNYYSLSVRPRGVNPRTRNAKCYYPTQLNHQASTHHAERAHPAPRPPQSKRPSHRGASCELTLTEPDTLYITLERNGVASSVSRYSYRHGPLPVALNVGCERELLAVEAVRIFGLIIRPGCGRSRD